MAKVMWSWCSIPLATLLKATYIQKNKRHVYFIHATQENEPLVFKMCGSNLEEVLGDESKSL